MRLSVISKQVEVAVEQANSARKKINDYTELALELERIAEKNGINVDHIRRVSGIELNSIKKVLKYKENGREDAFIEAFNKLEEYDKQRVRDVLNLN